MESIFPRTVQNGSMEGQRQTPASTPMEARPPTPVPMDLRTPSFQFNHGGYYAPADPRLCNNPTGICSTCQARIDVEEAAQTLLTLKSPSSCPSCKSEGTYVTHASMGLRTCNGCSDSFCTACFHGTRYCCVHIYGKLPPPPPMSPRSPPADLPSPVAHVTLTSDFPLRGLARAPAGGASLASQ